MAKKATINMVAERAGVSRGTVDRVLNQRPHVKPELRERIVRAMRSLAMSRRKRIRPLPLALRTRRKNPANWA